MTWQAGNTRQIIHPKHQRAAAFLHEEGRHRQKTTLLQVFRWPIDPGCCAYDTLHSDAHFHKTGRFGQRRIDSLPSRHVACSLQLLLPKAAENHLHRQVNRHTANN
jgi:hypothetical protein